MPQISLTERAHNALRQAALPAYGWIQQRRRRHLSDHERWERALGTEVDFWRTYLGDLVISDTSNYRRPDYAWSEEPTCAEVAPLLPEGRVEILDVGAGPMTAVPKIHPGREIHITAFDPLADAYNARLDELAIEPLVRTRQAAAEDLLDHVEAASFDLAHASNCLDHAYDPVLAIRNMVLAVRPGGLVFLRHERNEGANEHYLGLHQWNFDVRDRDFVVWRPGGERNVTRELAELASTEVRLRDGLIVCLLRRHAR